MREMDTTPGARNTRREVAASKKHLAPLGWLRRDSIKNHFPLPNVIYHLELSAGAIAVCGYLLHIEDRKTYPCYASYKTIGRAVRMSANTTSATPSQR